MGLITKITAIATRYSVLGYIAFIFDLSHSGINDCVKLPIIKKVYVIAQNGEIIAMLETLKTDDSWLSNLSGKFAFNHCLLAATDEGIIRLEVQKNKIIQTKLFTETEPYVNASSRLFANSKGIYVVNSQDIHLLNYS